MVRVSVKPLYVGGGGGSGGYYATLLRLGQFSFLMNCGASDALQLEDISLLLPHLNDIDAIFISHGTLRHVGGLPLLHRRTKQILSSSSESSFQRKKSRREDESMLSSSCEQRRDDSSSLPVNDRSREGFSGDDSTSRGKTQHSSHSERKGEGDKKKFSFNKENEELLCCCFSKKCFGFSVPAYMTQPAQRLGLVALDGAVRSRGCWGVCTPPNLEGGWINSPEWLVNQSGVQDGNEDEEQERKDEKDRSESKDERILVGKLYSCKSEADALLGSSISVSLADVNDVMQACRTLRYDERVCLRPRRRKQERRREEVERKTRGEDLERDEEKQGSMSPCGLTGGEECESDEDDDDVEVYVHCVRAGHTIGGAVWLFDAGGRKIIFGVDHCLSPLWHVDSSSLLHLLPSLLPTPSNPSPSSAFSSPSRWSFSPPCLFISDVHHSPVGASSWRVPTLRSLFLQIALVLHRGGDVIIPVDLGSPVLELLLHLEALWRLSPSLHSHHIFFVSPVALQFLLAVKPLLPQSTERFRSLFANQRVNPLYCSKSLPTTTTTQNPPTLYAAPPNAYHVIQKSAGDKKQRGGEDQREEGEGRGNPRSVLSSSGVEGDPTGSHAVSLPQSSPKSLGEEDPSSSAGNPNGVPPRGSSSSPATTMKVMMSHAAPHPGHPLSSSSPSNGMHGGNGGKKAVPGGIPGGSACHSCLQLVNPTSGGSLVVPAGGVGAGMAFGSLKFIKMLRSEMELDWVLREGEGGRGGGGDEEGAGGPERNTGSSHHLLHNTGHVFICAPASLDTGLSRELLLRFAEREDCVFFFLTEPWRGTTAHQLWKLAQPKPESGVTALSDGVYVRSKTKEEEDLFSRFPRLHLTQARRVCLPVEELYRLFEKERDQRIRKKKSRHGHGEGGVQKEEGDIKKERKEEESRGGKLEEKRRSDKTFTDRNPRSDQPLLRMKEQEDRKVSRRGKVKGGKAGKKGEGDGGESLNGGEEEDLLSPSSSSDEGEAEKQRDLRGLQDASTSEFGSGRQRRGEGEKGQMREEDEEETLSPRTSRKADRSEGGEGVGASTERDDEEVKSQHLQKKKQKLGTEQEEDVSVSGGEENEEEGERKSLSSSSKTVLPQVKRTSSRREEDEGGRGVEGRRDDFSLPIFGGGGYMEKLPGLHRSLGKKRENSQTQRSLLGEEEGRDGTTYTMKKQEEKNSRKRPRRRRGDSRGGHHSHYEECSGDPLSSHGEYESGDDEDDENLLSTLRGDGSEKQMRKEEEEEEDKKRKQRGGGGGGEEESHGDFGIALSDEQKALWAATTTSFSVNPTATPGNPAAAGLPSLPTGIGASGADGSYPQGKTKTQRGEGGGGMPVLSFSLLPWPDRMEEGGGDGSGGKANHEASGFEGGPAASLSAMMYGHLGSEDQQFIAGVPRKRQRKLNLLQAEAQAGRVSPAGASHLMVWGGLASSPHIPSAVLQHGVSPHAAVTFFNMDGSLKHPSLLMPGSSPYGVDGGPAFSSSSSSAVPSWRKQLRQWNGGEEPTCLQIRRLSLAVRCCVRCFTGGLEGVTGVQSLVHFISLLQPLNVFLLPSNPIASDLLSLSPMAPLQHSSSFRGRKPRDDKTIDTPGDTFSRGEQKKEGSGGSGDESRFSSCEETKHANKPPSVVPKEDEDKGKEIKMMEESEREEKEEGCGVMQTHESQEQDEQKSDRSADHKKANGSKNDSDKEEADKTSSSCFSASGKDGRVKKEKPEDDVVSASSFSDRKTETFLESSTTKQRRKEAYEFIDCLVSSIGAALGPNCSVQVLLPPYCFSSSSPSYHETGKDARKQLTRQHLRKSVVSSPFSLSSQGHSSQHPRETFSPPCFSLSCHCPCRDHPFSKASLPYEQISTLQKKGERARKEPLNSNDSSPPFPLSHGENGLARSSSFVENQFASFLFETGESSLFPWPHYSSLSFLYHKGVLTLPSEQVVLQLDRCLWVEFARSACPALTESHLASEVYAKKRAMQLELEMLKNHQSPGVGGGRLLMGQLLRHEAAGTLSGNGTGNIRHCFVSRIHATAVDMMKTTKTTGQEGHQDGALTVDQQMRKQHQEGRGGDGNRRREGKAGGVGGEGDEGVGKQKAGGGGEHGGMKTPRNGGVGSSRRRRRRRFQGWSDDKDEKTAAGDFWCLPLKPTLRLIPCDDSEGVRIDGSSAISLSLPPPCPPSATTTHLPLSSSYVDGRGDSLTRSSRLSHPPQPSHARNHRHSSQPVSSSSCSSPRDEDAEMTRNTSPGTPRQAPSPQRQLPGDSCSFSNDHFTRGDYQGRSQLGRSEDEEEDLENEEENSSDGVNTVLYRQRKYRVSAGERKSTLLLGRMKLRDIASYLKGHLSHKRGEGRSGENQKSKENEDQGKEGESGREGGDEDLDFIRMVSDLGLTLTVGDCASLRIVQDHNGGHAALWRLESFPHPWFFYLRRLFQSQPFALTGS